MELKALARVFLLLSSLLVSVQVSEAGKLRQEVVRKTVSVKSPKRDTSVISHFNPAVHEYAAEGNVVIDREIPKVVTPKPPPENLAKKVLVQSPITSSSEHRHFDPAAHEYEATGEVLINKDSPFLNHQRHIFQSIQNPSEDRRFASSNQAASGFSLAKSVSVKSPTRQSSVINHFNPAGHIYAATGNVVINKSSRSSRPDNDDDVFQHRFRSTPQSSRPTHTAQQKIKTRAPSSSGLSLSKSVSVQSPKRASSVISHFNPAGHVYAATGGVNINRSPSSQSVPTIKRTNFATPKIEVSRPKIEVSRPKIRYSLPDSGEKQVFISQRKPEVIRGSNLSLKKTVSVKSPQRESSVINHFNPAGHIYAATGGVTINRTPSQSAQSIKQTNFAGPKIEVRKPKVEVSRPRVSYSLPDSGEKSVFISQREQPKRIRGSNLSLQKTVSVKSPQRESSVISHFNPAGHIYAATGGVTINRSSSSQPASSIKRTNFATPKIEVRRPKVEVSRPRVSYSLPDSGEKSVFISQREQPKRIRGSNLSLQKTVSVKSPQRESSVISHFNPAGHIYAATGGVTINRSSPSQSTPSIKQTNFATPKIKVSRPKVEAPRPRVRYTLPDSGETSTFISQKEQPKKIRGSNLSLQKTVSVKSPQRDSSVISHFNPAGHIYAATGGVNINRSSRPIKSSVPNIKTSRPKSTIRIKDSREDDSSKLQRLHASRSKTSSFSLQKSVSVKSPQRASSVISHFNPAGHIYAATGGVSINRSPSRQNSQIVTKKVKTVPAIKVSRHRTSSKQEHRDSEEESKERTSNKFEAFPSQKRISSGFKLQKSVSVKSPTRQSSVINHFSPAQHDYEATGNVVISRDSSSERESGRYIQPQPARNFRVFKAKPLPSPARVSKPKPNLFKLQKIKENRPQSSGFQLQKSVSVKSPQRKSTVINHFNPAEHEYAATGGVAINRSPAVQNVKSASVKQTYVAPPQKVSRSRKKDSDEDRSTSFSSIRTESRPSKKRVQSGLDLKKSVSVKSPERKSSVISHFTPAQHVYEATGNVVISRDSSSEAGSFIFSQQKPSTNRGIFQVKSTQSSKPLTSKFATKVASSRVQSKKLPEFNLRKTVSIKPSGKSSSTIRQSVAKAQSSRPSILTTQNVNNNRNKFIFRQHSNSKDDFSHESESSGLSLKKSVSVKSPQRQSSVISHFTPAGHNYEATGNVVINRQSSSRYSQALPIKTAVSKPKSISPQFKISKTPSSGLKFVSKRPQTTSSQGSNFNLKKSVTVKSPNRASSVISHFNPSGHVYAATGGVNINRASSQPRVQQRVQTSKTVTHSAPKINVSRPRVSVKSQKTVSGGVKSSSTSSQKTSSFALPKRVSSGINLKKSVSVKSPQQQSSVINHFTPAGHVYEATGSVVINRDSSSELNVERISQPRLSKNKPSTFKTTSTSSRVKVSRKPVPSISRPVFQDRPQSSQFNLKKSVSVKTPERVSSVISHFDPKEHVYEAVGGVNINRTPSQKNIQSVKPNTFVAPVVQVYRQPQSSNQRERESKEDSSATRFTPTKIESSKSSQKLSGLSLKKSVSVKSPQIKSSVISHFSPAQHVYEATGGVVINRGASSGLDGIKISQSQVNRGNVGTPKVKPPKAKISPKPVSITLKRKQTSVKQGPGLTLQKAVSVKSPQRPSSVISHFDPAEHVYEATGGVSISRSPSRPIVETLKQVTVTAPKTEIFTPQIKLRPKPDRESKVESKRVQIPLLDRAPARKEVSSSLNLEKVVSVKSPERKSSVISHFTPAQHKYEATGKVVISKGSSSVIGASLPVFKPIRTTFVKEQSEDVDDSRDEAKIQISRVQKIERPAVLPTITKISVPEVTYDQPTRFNVFDFHSDNNDSDGDDDDDDADDSDSGDSTGRDDEDSDDSDERGDYEGRKDSGDDMGMPLFKLGSISSPKQISSALTVEKSVSVKSPERQSTVISHFTPKEHSYEATGKVVINKSSQGPSSSLLTNFEPVKTFMPEKEEMNEPSAEEVNNNYQLPSLIFNIPKPTISIEPMSVPVIMPLVEFDKASSEENQEPKFDFGPAPTYDFLSGFEGIASYLPPNPSKRR